MSKTIVITGSSSGVGLALGNYFSSKGYKVFGLSRSIPENTQFKTIPTDITHKSELENAFREILQEVDSIDLLINNAGKGMVGPAENGTKEEILSLFSLNLIAVTDTISLILPIMRKNNSGKIFNISSIGSIMGLPFRGYYSASKSALDMVTESLRYELSSTPIQICTINLGDVKTNIADNRIKSEIPAIYRENFDRVYQGMNTDVDNGFEPSELAPFLEKLFLQKSNLKPHYYFGSFTQKLSVLLKALIPQTWFEKIIKKYSNL